MGYQLQISRDEGKISKEEWIEVVKRTEGVRLSNRDWVSVNPRTGSEIRMKSGEAIAEVLLKESGLMGWLKKPRWVKVFVFRDGRIVFKGTASLDSPRHPVRQAAARLARKLRARVRGEEFEEYRW